MMVDMGSGVSLENMKYVYDDDERGILGANADAWQAETDRGGVVEKAPIS